jgi:tetratricopeptide (TPR) repeat protein
LPPLFDRTKGGFYHLPHHRLGEWDAVTLVGGLLRLPAERDATGRELAAWSKVPVRVPSSQEAEIVERVGRVCDVPVEHVLALKELAGAAHGHLFLLRFAAAQLHEPEATWDQVMARLRHLGGQDLEARLDAMIGQMFEDLERRGFAATRVAQALTVFQGGAATDALQFVCCGRHLPSTSAEAIVHGDYGSALKRASLLEFEPATQRLGLHPLVRHYVLTRRMPAERDLAGWKQAHALWFAQLAHRQRGDFAALEQERLNLLAGAATVQELGDDRRLVDLAEDLFPWLWVRGHWLDARRLLSAALAAARRLDRISSEALLLHGLGLVCRSLGDYDDAQRNYEACIALEQAAHHRKALAQTLHEFALLCLARGDHAGARSACRRALPLQEEIDDHVGQAYTRSTLALLDLLAYELASAEAHHRRALQLAKEAGHPYLQALSWLGLAISALARNQPDEALVGWDSGRVLEHVPSGLIMKAATLHTLAVLAGECGETAEACRLFREALQWEAKAGDRAAQSETLRELALACQRLDQLDAAHAAMEDSLAHARDLGDRLGRTRALWSHGTLEREESATAVANELHRAGLAIAEEIGNSYWQGQHLDGLAQCAQALGQQAEAQRLAVQAQAKLGGPPRRYICFWDRNKLESERLSLGQPVSFPFGED